MSCKTRAKTFLYAFLIKIAYLTNRFCSNFAHKLTVNDNGYWCSTIPEPYLLKPWYKSKIFFFVCLFEILNFGLKACYLIFLKVIFFVFNLVCFSPFIFQYDVEAPKINGIDLKKKKFYSLFKNISTQLFL